MWLRVSLVHKARRAISQYGYTTYVKRPHAQWWNWRIKNDKNADYYDPLAPGAWSNNYTPGRSSDGGGGDCGNKKVELYEGANLEGKKQTLGCGANQPVNVKLTSLKVPPELSVQLVTKQNNVSNHYSGEYNNVGDLWNDVAHTVNVMKKTW